MEELVKQRETELHNEKNNVENMLYSIMPRYIRTDSLFSVLMNYNVANNSFKYISLIAPDVSVYTG